MRTAYLQHGKAGEPMRTESVEVKESALDWQKKGLTYTETGYGARIPTRYMVRYKNRWRRVYCMIYSNIGTLYIGKNIKSGIIVSMIEG